MIPTLESIKAKHAEIGKMIDALAAQAKPIRYACIPQQHVALSPTEEYAGLIIGAPSHNLILLPGEFQGDWEAATKWARSIGGELPTRREQALLYANLPGEFKSEWYWSGEQHASGAGSAWFQSFGGGNQYYLHKSLELRARAVRRSPI